jgi:hypothetical protein
MKNYHEVIIYVCTLCGKVPNNNSYRQVSWLVTIGILLLIPPGAGQWNGE